MPSRYDFTFQTDRDELPQELVNSSQIIIVDEYFYVTKWDDATWVLTSAFIIFTMQSGFGLLESGSVSHKNEVNIMVKNAVDVLFGGMSYWMFGYGMSFGTDGGSNAFIGVGYYFGDYTTADKEDQGHLLSHLFFHTSFATTATTIVSGAMAERTKLETYIMFSFVNTLIFSIPAHWMWSPMGWLHKMGAVDVAGASTVHLVGGVTGLIATMMLGPRFRRFGDNRDHRKEDDDGPKMGSPTNMVFGMFMLW